MVELAFQVAFQEFKKVVSIAYRLEVAFLGKVGVEVHLAYPLVEVGDHLGVHPWEAYLEAYLQEVVAYLAASYHSKGQLQLEGSQGVEGNREHLEVASYSLVEVGNNTVIERSRDP